MFENIVNFFKRFGKNNKENSSAAAKERLHLVLAQDRANISADFLEMMKQEIIDVIKKYIEIDEEAIDVRMTNKAGEDGIIGAPALYANIPIVTIKNEARKLEGTVIKENQNVSKTIENIDMNAQTEKEENKEKSNSEKTSNIEPKMDVEETIVERAENCQENNTEEPKENLNNTKNNTLNKKQGQKTENKKNSNTKSKNKKSKRG